MKTGIAALSLTAIMALSACQADKMPASPSAHLTLDANGAFSLHADGASTDLELVTDDRDPGQEYRIRFNPDQPLMLDLTGDRFRVTGDKITRAGAPYATLAEPGRLGIRVRTDAGNGLPGYEFTRLR